ncbi:uncharacterized protein C8Q71DRAFT_437689 [Rhodofomes roseus]|uniref:DUF6534 domain-containing protein n=1 Tax=Rhodofomes roseus TaxID=34475 RepID=A0A4Y9YK74_9APHY|nr:uncharacterized protein C8Q71DRAFT_437689 [Rhodofomes roseus]KAH9841076.1 hypothetical protein C8Q71DRAFT_437689 [Rhodofomes roseus]TFY62218.1 hypothetical protein EVJ58_g4005 [Rhodofomes roseus]
MATPAEKLAETTEGPALVGVFMNLTLYGVMISQSVFYYTNYPKDPTWIKAYVALLVTADTLNAVFICVWIYRVLINNFGNQAALGIGDWLFETEQALTGIISFQVQMFYAWRIWKLVGNRWLVAVVAITATIGGLSGIGTAIAIGIRPEFLGLIHLKSIIICWLLGEGISDIIITVVLTWYLRRHLGGYSKTDGIVTKVMHLIVSNGALTATFAIGDLICYFATDEAYHLIFNFPLCKLYGNSVMSTLNARAIFMTSSKDAASAYQSDPPIRFNQSGRPDITGILATSVDKTRANQTQIMVNVETHEMSDIQGQEHNPDDIKAGMVV